MKDTMTVDQLVSDTIEVTNYLRKRFGQNKIYLMAHSWRSFIDIQAAAKAQNCTTHTLEWVRYQDRFSQKNWHMNI